MISFAAAATLAVVIFAVVVFTLFVSEDKSNRNRKTVIGFIGFGLMYALLGSLAIYFGPMIDKYLDDLLHKLGLYYGYAIVFWGLVIAGFLFWLKISYLRFYAILECVVGVLALVVFSQSHHAIDVTSLPNYQTATITGWIYGFAAPIYILIRGFTNLSKSRRNKANAVAEAE